MVPGHPGEPVRGLEDGEVSPGGAGEFFSKDAARKLD